MIFSFRCLRTCDNGIVPHFESRFPADDPRFLEDIEISPGIVGRALGRMKMNASACPDKIPPIFFRKTGNSISFPLALMFRTFLDLHQDSTVRIIRIL